MGSNSIYKMSSEFPFFRCVFYLPVQPAGFSSCNRCMEMDDKYDGLLNYIIKGFGGYSFPILPLRIILILFTTSIGQPIVLYVASLGNVVVSLEEQLGRRSQFFPGILEI